MKDARAADSSAQPSSVVHRLLRAWRALGVGGVLVGVAVWAITTYLPRVFEDHPRDVVQIDRMHSTAGWEEYADETGSSVELRSFPGTGHPFTVSYSLAGSGWIGITKDLPAGLLSGTRAIAFRYRGSGRPNTIELKLIYDGGVIFGWDWHRATDTHGGWESREIPYSDFKCWSATGCRAGEPVDQGRVEKVDFAVSNKPQYDDAAGRGSIAFENLEAVKG